MLAGGAKMTGSGTSLRMRVGEHVKAAGFQSTAAHGMLGS